MTDDFFRNRLVQMIDLRYPLAVLASRMPCQEIEASLAQRWARQVKAGKKIDDLDLFGPVSVVAGGKQPISHFLSISTKNSHKIEDSAKAPIVSRSENL